MNLVEMHSVDVKLLIYHVYSYVHVVMNAISVGIHSTADEDSTDDDDESLDS